MGRPTRVASATYTIVDTTRGIDSDDREVVAPTAVNVDAVSTLLTSAAGRNTAIANSLAIASGANMAEGRTYLLTATDGSDREAVVCKSVGAASFVATNPVRGIYPVNSTLRGVELVATFPSAWANDETRLIEQGREFEIVWTYTLGDHSVITAEPMPTQRWSIQPWIDEDYLLAGRTNLRDRLQPDQTHGALVAATRKVIGELEASDLHAEEYRHTEAGRIAVCEYALHVVYGNFAGDTHRDLAEQHLEAYKVQIHKLVQGKVAGAHVVDRDTAVSRPVYDDLKIFQLP